MRTATTQEQEEERDAAPAADAAPRPEQRGAAGADGDPRCGDFGGTKHNTDEPCGRKAGWGTDHLGTGRCQDHTESARLKRRRLVEKAHRLQLEHPEWPKTRVAREVGLHPVTLWEYEDAEPDLHQQAREVNDALDRLRVRRVEDTLFRKIVEGDAAAAETIFWLTNRAPGRWKHARHLEVSGPEGGPIELTRRVAERRREMDLQDLSLEEKKQLEVLLRRVERNGGVPAAEAEDGEADGNGVGGGGRFLRLAPGPAGPGGPPDGADGEGPEPGGS